MELKKPGTRNGSSELKGRFHPRLSLEDRDKQMKKDSLIEDNQEEIIERPEALELETDDEEASDLLEIIERDAVKASALEERTERAAVVSKEDPSMALESLYFRSFGQRPLLNRGEELALAKRIDQGSRGVRMALREAVGIAAQMRKSEALQEAIEALREIRGLSGLSAIALARAEANLNTLIAEAKGPSKAAAARVKRLMLCRRQARESRAVLEKGKDEMVRCNLRLVVDIAKHYNGRGLGLLDLVQEGNIGLMKAAERYQHRKGFKFSTYATWWVRQGITRALADQSRTIRIPVHMTEASHRIVRTARRLVQQLGREAHIEEVGQALRTRPEKIQETMRVFQEPISLENPIGDGETLFGELIADRQAVTPDSHVHRTELTRELDRILGTLTPREQTVIRLRFGIGQDEPCTLEQVGQSLSVTRERIRQIEAKAIKKLKTPEIKQMFEAIK
ncbi:MAG: RNA polymerase sigma factor RpoD/SigA [Nitrospirae bacterium]|nr:MAG: RNA polymerase sigma factor RpoD/SigA [Nitrospirota bacterium]